jgi:hypothetical protein
VGGDVGSMQHCAERAGTREFNTTLLSHNHHDENGLENL